MYNAPAVCTPRPCAPCGACSALAHFIPFQQPCARPCCTCYHVMPTRNRPVWEKPGASGGCARAARAAASWRCIPPNLRRLQPHCASPGGGAGMAHPASTTARHDTYDSPATLAGRLQAAAVGGSSTLLAFLSPHCRLCKSLEADIRRVEESAGVGVARVNALHDRQWAPEVRPPAGGGAAASAAAVLLLPPPPHTHKQLCNPVARLQIIAYQVETVPCFVLLDRNGGPGCLCAAPPPWRRRWGCRRMRKGSKLPARAPLPTPPGCRQGPGQIRPAAYHPADAGGAGRAGGGSRCCRGSAQAVTNTSKVHNDTSSFGAAFSASFFASGGCPG